jgi:hypothetical protein
MLAVRVGTSRLCQFCCKSPKILGVKFFERNEAHYDSLITMAPRPLARPPVSFSSGDEVPRIFIRESHLRARKIWISSGKRLLQQNRHISAVIISLRARMSVAGESRPDHSELGLAYFLVRLCPSAKPGATMDRDADGGGIHANNSDCWIHACGHVFIRQSRACRRHLVRVLCLAYELRLLLVRAMPSYCLGQWRILRTESLLGEWRATAKQISA